jgi:hypothetical protein
VQVHPSARTGVSSQRLRQHVFCHLASSLARYLPLYITTSVIAPGTTVWRLGVHILDSEKTSFRWQRTKHQATAICPHHLEFLTPKYVVKVREGCPSLIAHCHSMRNALQAALRIDPKRTRDTDKGSNDVRNQFRNRYKKVGRSSNPLHGPDASTAPHTAICDHYRQTSTATRTEARIAKYW